MREFLTSGQVGNIELNEQKRIRKEINERWDKLGMTEGLKGVTKENVACLFENEAKHLLREAVAADNSGSFETVVFPIIRRVFSKLLANDIVSVQAMNLPVGKLFYMLPVTSDREWLKADGVTPAEGLEDGVIGRHTGLMGYTRTDRRNGNQYNRFYLPDEAICAQEFVAINASGEQRTLSATTYDAAVLEAGEDMVMQVSPKTPRPMRKTLYDLFYNDFLFDNSKGKIHIKVNENVEKMVWNKWGALVELASDSALTIPTYNDGTVRNIIVKVTGFEKFGASKLTGPDGNEMDSEAFLASLKVVAASAITAGEGETSGFTSTFEENEELNYRVVTQKYGKGIVEYDSICDAEGAIYLDIDLAKPVTKQGATIDGYAGIDPEQAANAAFKVAWAQYDSLELETEIGEVGFKLDSVTVSVQERKLRATWSPELAQDVSAFHNIDAEAELTALLSEQIAAEIDREILRDLRHASPWNIRWDVNGWRRMAGFSTNYTQKDWNQELVTAINQVSAQIHKATLRGGANFIVVGPEVSAVFNNLEYFHVSDASAESDQYNMGIERIGALGNRYQVYMDPYAKTSSVLVGHKGKSILDSGYIYAPYIPLQLTPTMYNPENFAPVKGILTRYAKKCVNMRFYGQVIVDGLRTWDINELR